MPLDGTATAAQHLAGFVYVAGDTPEQVQLWDATAQAVVGDPVSIVRDEDTLDLEAVEAGLLDDEEFIGFTAVPLVAGQTYLHRGAVHTAEEVEDDRAGGEQVQSRCILRRAAQ